MWEREKHTEITPLYLTEIISTHNLCHHTPLFLKRDSVHFSSTTVQCSAVRFWWKHNGYLMSWLFWGEGRYWMFSNTRSGCPCQLREHFKKSGIRLWGYANTHNAGSTADIESQTDSDWMHYYTWMGSWGSSQEDRHNQTFPNFKVRGEIVGWII